MKVTLQEVSNITDSTTWENFCDKHGYGPYIITELGGDTEVEVSRDEYAEIVNCTL